jgi:type IVB pilus formation R64 PilN family outer membrane protein
MNNKNFKHLALSIVAMGVLSACTSPQMRAEVDNDTKRIITKVDQVNQTLPSEGAIRGSNTYAEKEAREQQNAKVMKRATRSWIGNTMVPVNADDKLPPVFTNTYTMNFADRGRPVDLATVAARLSQQVGMPVRVQADVYASSMPTSASGVRQLPPVSAPTSAPARGLPAGSVSAGQAMSTDSISMNWNGTLVDFLNQLTDRLNLSWEYRDNSIVIMKFTTELHELATFPNGYDYTLNSGSTGNTAGEGTSNTSNLTVAETGKIEGQKSLIDVIKKIVESAPGSEVLQAEGSGRLLVKTSRDLQSQVREIVRAENAKMLKQVHVQLDIYSVTNMKDDQQGVNWSAFYRDLAGRYGVDVLSPASLVGPDAGAVTFSVPPGTANNTNSRFGGSAAVLEALYQIGNNVQHRPITLVAMNRQWARKARLNTTGYLSETRPAVGGVLGGAGGVPGLQTDEVTTGDQFSVMPYVLDNNTVMLKMGISLSDLLDLFEVTTGDGPTLQRVQTPNTSSITDQYTIALKPGEVMAITGLSRETSTFDERRLTENAPLLAGGSRNLGKLRENFIVFVRAIVL